MSEFSNEEIARAAGLSWLQGGLDAKGMTCTAPDWCNDPGAVATWLLPVLQKRGYVVTIREAATQVHHETNDGLLCSLSTWHECVIAAIMATREGKA